ncbi:MAG: hypothetical protein EHM24_21660 [Acidobacteria bacterium]|nr:MAG: hypothetical protein EHM24_21660 [Acidobacteriota bacterium]
MSELWTIAVGTVQGLGGLVVFLLVLLIGFCRLFDWTKFRPTAKSRTVKSLDERVGPAIIYLPPDAPRGPSDQLAGSVRR